ncbi:MAG: hypothetical protein OXD45_15630 [Rhodobacteraceae bacterium]|nr:hypothetical protein [Paracoccaceae bacterium]MCY4307227.1 hypothetical protein [Paracoccaceae bacterium]
MQKNIDDTLKVFVQQHLAPAEMVQLKTEEDEDIDGNPILRIWVVYKAENDRIDPEKAVSLPRLLRQSFADLYASHYPLFSYIIPEQADFATLQSHFHCPTIGRKRLKG